MSNKILVTDSLFIFDEHVKKLKAAGYDIERLDTPTATEEQLVEAIKGKVGYILGGIEKVTDKVIDAADELKVVVFTGADYKYFIPGWERAREKGLVIVNGPGSNMFAVSEFAMGMALAMQRNLFELGRTGSKTFETTGSMKDASIGVIGTGRIGAKIISISHAFSPKDVMYYSRSEKSVDARYVELDELLETSDIIFVAVPGEVGQLLDRSAIERIKANALIVNISPVSIFDLNALLVRLKSNTLRAALDYPAPSTEFTELPFHTWFNTNDHTAYNTHQATRVASDMAVESIINILQTGDDTNRVV